jgi:hypothetical protein
LIRSPLFFFSRILFFSPDVLFLTVLTRIQRPRPGHLKRCLPLPRNPGMDCRSPKILPGTIASPHRRQRYYNQ